MKLSHEAKLELPNLPVLSALTSNFLSKSVNLTHPSLLQTLSQGPRKKFRPPNLAVKALHDLVPAFLSNQSTLLLDLSTLYTIYASIGLLPQPVPSLPKGQTCLSCLPSSSVTSSRKSSLTTQMSKTALSSEHFQHFAYLESLNVGAPVTSSHPQPVCPHSQGLLFCPLGWKLPEDKT